MNEKLKTLQKKLTNMIEMWRRETAIASNADARHYVYFLEGRIDGLNSALLYLTDLIQQEKQEQNK